MPSTDASPRTARLSPASPRVVRHAAMTTWGYVGLMIVAGALIAFQSPINAALGRSVGVFEASLVSFIIGSLVAAGIVFFFGKGDVRAVTQVPWWQLLGGGLGLLSGALCALRGPDTCPSPPPSS